MRRLLTVPILLLAIGCSKTHERNSQQSVQGFVATWSEMGMWLPGEEQIDFFHSNLRRSQEPLTTALNSPSYEVRMRAAYVIGKIGTDARLLGPALLQRLKNEPDRLVRLYLYKALRDVRFSEPTTIEHLKQRFALLDEANQEPQPGESNSEYLDADEKIRIAETLYVLDQGPDRKSYLDFILKWLREPDESQTASQRHNLWERRLGAVLALEDMPDAIEAKPVLRALKSEKDAPSWVSVHVPRVLESLK